MKRVARILGVVSFADRNRPKSDLPPRVITEEAPEAVRRYLLDLLEEDGELDAYDVDGRRDVEPAYAGIAAAQHGGAGTRPGGAGRQDHQERERR